ncbi:MAG: DUF1273 family protein [Alistipes sp.]|nr:DUF1273 family protein [Alistipes sp.]
MDKRYNIVAFTGHRTYNGSANELLRATICELYNEGARHFRVGMAEGFDLAAGEMVVELMYSDSNIVLEACIPWPTFDAHFTPEERKRYNHILQHATVVRYSDNAYHPAIFRHRNDMLVEGADTLIAWWNGGQSGTAYTVKRAKKLGINIKNIYPKNQLSIEFNA